MCKKRKTSKDNKQSEKELTYSVSGHKISIIIQILLVSVICLFGIPWILRGLLWCFDKMSGYGYFHMADSEENLALGLLPDLFGSFVGLIIGFFFDFTYIEQWRHLEKYEALCATLARELKEKEKIELVRKKDNISEEIEYLDRFVLDDIVTSFENLSILINLPMYITFPFFSGWLKKKRLRNGINDSPQDSLEEPSKKGGFGFYLSACINKINEEIEQFNSSQNKSEEKGKIENRAKKILTLIGYNK